MDDIDEKWEKAIEDAAPEWAAESAAEDLQERLDMLSRAMAPDESEVEDLLADAVSQAGMEYIEWIQEVVEDIHREALSFDRIEFAQMLRECWASYERADVSAMKMLEEGHE